MTLTNKSVYQSADLMRFIRYINVDEMGEVVMNVIDAEPNFISRFYTPQFRVNKVSSSILTLIADNGISETNKQLSEDSITYKLLNSGLKLTAPYVYQLAQTIVLECFALIYAVEEDETLFKYIDEDDVKITRENVKYIIDYLGTDRDYTDIVMDLHSMDVALGYVQRQIPVIQGGLPVDGTL